MIFAREPFCRRGKTVQQADFDQFGRSTVDGIMVAVSVVVIIL